MEWKFSSRHTQERITSFNRLTRVYWQDSDRILKGVDRGKSVSVGDDPSCTYHAYPVAPRYACLNPFWWVEPRS